MHRLEDRTREKDAVGKQPPDRLTVLGWTTALALLGNTLVYIFQFFFLRLVLGINVIPVLIFSLLTLVASGLVLARLRWAPLLGALVACVITVILLFVPDTIAALLHPAVDPGHFSSTLFTLAFALVAIVAGIATTIQTSRSRQIRAPSWLAPFLSGVGCFAVGAVIVTIIASGNLVSASLAVVWWHQHDWYVNTLAVFLAITYSFGVVFVLLMARVVSMERAGRIREQASRLRAEELLAEVERAHY